MKIKYKGYIIEGNAEEIKYLISKRKYKITKKHRESIRKGMKNMWKERKK